MQANDGTVPYSVQAVLPENQINQNVSYFDIEMEHGQSQELEVIIFNSSDEEITVEVSNNPALTNSNGLIVYDGLQEGEDLHDSMTEPFSEISSIDDTSITVAAGEQETVTVTVEAPGTSFDGIILGGLYFTLVPEEKDEAEGVTIQNRYSYALAVQIAETANDTEVEANIDIINVEAGIINYRTGLQTEFVNTVPKIVNLDIEANVFADGEDEILYSRSEEDFTVAPNSTFKLPVMYDNQPLEPGEYVLEAVATDGDQTWNFEETFEVTEEIADEANEEAVELVEDDNNDLLIYLLIGLSVIVGILLIIVVYLMIKRKK